MVRAHARKPFRDYNQIAKYELPSLTVLFKNLPQKCWPRYLRNYTDYSDGTYNYLGKQALMEQNENVYINIFMKLKNIFLIYAYIYIYIYYIYICIYI